ncbi:proteinase inhibitor I25 [Striga asiatica]|uniref:Proteinase inhibitor I25 n=1 Tax=Striga asiatica TaxID=4170 RepID=A0A5A7P1R1_STRAF|nr:proteinase inhibitor I25 [Striga asiatica]
MKCCRELLRHSRDRLSCSHRDGGTPGASTGPGARLRSCTIWLRSSEKQTTILSEKEDQQERIDDQLAPPEHHSIACNKTGSELQINVKHVKEVDKCPKNTSYDLKPFVQGQAPPLAIHHRNIEEERVE